MSNWLAYAETLISQDLGPELATHLELVPLATSSESTIYLLLNKLLTLCTTYDSPTSAMTLYDTWFNVDQIFKELLSITYYSYLFLQPPMTPEALAYLAPLIPADFTTVVSDLARQADRDNTVGGCIKALTVFGEQDNSVYTALTNDADSAENYAVYQWLFSKYSDTSEYAPVPSWVITQNPLPPYNIPTPQITVSVSKSDIDLTSPNVEEQYEQIVKITGEPDEELRALLHVGTAEQRKEAVERAIGREVMLDVQMDQTLFRLYGPDNPEEDAPIEDLEQFEYRMFKYNQLIEDEDADGIGDWFDGTCHECGRKILRRWHALRVPIESGGWISCVCSQECGDNRILRTVPEKSTQTFRRLLLEVVVYNLEKYGIIDREGS